jgi:ABC-type transporter Mla subunit MlaD
MDVKLGEGKSVSSVEELLVSINEITHAVEPVEYSLNTMRGLTIASLTTSPLDGVTDPTKKQLLATEVGLLQPFNANVAEAEEKLTKLATISTSLAATTAALRKVTTMEAGLGSAQTSVETDVASLKSAMGAIGGDVDVVMDGFASIAPAVKTSVADYATCGWVSKNYASMKVAVCRDTVDGLHDIGLYLFAGALLFFLSFFLHLHISAFLAAYSEHGYEMVELTAEFGSVIKA